jgi:hypothetical protein
MKNFFETVRQLDREEWLPYVQNNASVLFNVLFNALVLVTDDSLAEAASKGSVNNGKVIALDIDTFA